MRSPQVLSVNVGTPEVRPWSGRGRGAIRSAIRKSPVAGPVTVRRLGLGGDQVADTRHHGGLDQAVYAFAREDLDAWGDRLGSRLPDGAFGENLTTRGLDVNAAEIGECWRIGTAVLQVASVRIPCANFKAWLGECGLDTKAWVNRFTAEGRPGPYLRVSEEGELRAGDALEVVHRPGHGVSVTTMFRALTTNPELLPLLLRVDGLPDEARSKAEKWTRARL